MINVKALPCLFKHECTFVGSMEDLMAHVRDVHMSHLADAPQTMRDSLAITQVREMLRTMRLTIQRFEKAIDSR